MPFEDSNISCLFQSKYKITASVSLARTHRADALEATPLRFSGKFEPAAVVTETIYYLAQKESVRPTD